MEGDVVEYRIDRGSGVPAYVQIVEQTERALRMGTLKVGDKLPTAREVVAATAINPNTVLRAYRDMEQAGLVELRRGLGTFVTRSLARPGAEDDSPLRAELTDWTARARAAGLERADILALVAAALDAHDSKQDEQDEHSPGDREQKMEEA
ncbi:MULTISPECIES: GntR family transcriptional regulator [Streptomyces]|uniref:GntR family transcriptional regulator n=1 Tax=Streptomyces stelliscabiei TaxID=146820 RepID=A0A8I0P767_9ACTN|nr:MULTISPECIES: GntR family transcriptional regulator [Streptomyces]KND40640.1 GntR family transcriptional regulator [Streptomyces stelliscabiei]KRD22679.1 GntR family transcriptional regulator [Streptomyces sp. Root264]MBE1600778.1 GntR family transcriptional regulator [Streptomyces stelliscabiei]MCX5268682.1 GntR family transcriptional regulator [Streptomyces sp. NBC_00199]MDX2519240.1 GntR family transcriptional regulator [Streptomyces stelliscabiei]